MKDSDLFKVIFKVKRTLRKRKSRTNVLSSVKGQSLNAGQILKLLLIREDRVLNRRSVEEDRIVVDIVNGCNLELVKHYHVNERQV